MKKRTTVIASRRLRALPAVEMAHVRGGNVVPCVTVYGVQPCIAVKGVQPCVGRRVIEPCL